MQHEDFDDITAAILVGGKSRRMGVDKAFLEIEGVPLFERVLEVCRAGFAQVILAGDRPERFTRYQLPIHPDIYPGSALGGLHSALFHAQTPYVFAAACDIPFPSLAAALRLASLRQGYDVVVPTGARGFEPLFAVYSRSCLDAMRNLLDRGNFCIFDFYPEVRVKHVPIEELSRLDGTRSFLNVNTPDQFAQACRKEIP